MKNNQDYIRDISEIRSMMERSSKFLSLSGWAGIMAGIYALAGVYIAYAVFNFNPDKIIYRTAETTGLGYNLTEVILLALLVLTLALITAIFFSKKSAEKRGEKIWNATSSRLLAQMLVPLLSGGVIILVLISKGFTGLAAPLTLIFYGLSLYNASKVTINEVKILGFIQLGLGMISIYFVEYALLLWAAGFGLAHIIYGIYMYFRYER